MTTALALLAACRDDARPRDPGAGSPCEQVPGNPWVLRCAVALEGPPAGVALTLRRDGDGLVRTFTSPEARARHELLAWGLRSDTSYAWRATRGDTGAEVGAGRLSTAPVPLGFPPMPVTTTGAPPDAPDAVLVAPRCLAGTAVLLDTEGEVVGSVDLALAAGLGGPLQILAMDWTPEHTVVALLGRNHVVEADLAGDLVMHLWRGEHFDEPLHHAIARHDGLTYALHMESWTDEGGQAYALDGVTVFDADGAQVDRFSTRGWYTPWLNPIPLETYWRGEDPAAHDFSHGNGLSVGDDGDLLVSFRHLSAVARARGGPGSEGFGELRWTLAPDPEAAVPSDFAVVGEGAAFQRQHHAAWAAPGAMILFDNGVGDRPSRGLELRVDEARREVEVIASFPFDDVCLVHGSAFAVRDGRRLFGCARAAEARLFDGDGELAWSLVLGCAGEAASGFPAAIPVDF